MSRHTNGFLEEYADKVFSGEIIAGREMKQGLERLIAGLTDPRYVYDTTEADRRIDFMEHCVRLTKSPFYGQPMKMMLWQKAWISALYGFKMRTDGTDRFRRTLLMIGRKNSKALALDTRIPTPEGDRTMEDICPGDFVFNEFGKPVKVIATSEIFHNHKCYRVTFEDGDEIIADAQHLWTVQTKGSRRIAKYQSTSSRPRPVMNKFDDQARFTVTTEEMVKDFKRRRADNKGTEYKYRVPVSGPLEYPEKQLFNPYILGLWLGDGDKKDNRLTASKDDLPQLLELLEAEGMPVYSVKMFSGKYEVRFGTKYAYHKHDVREAFREMGVWKNKHIPDAYFTASKEQRLALLQGLMDTDGTCELKGQCVFSNKNEEIARGVSKLLTSLGIKHNIRVDDAMLYGKNCGKCYSVGFFVDKDHSVFRYRRKTARLKDHLAPRMLYKSIVNIEEVEPRDTKCIQVDSESGLFLCGQKNTVTHNSETCSALGLTEMIIGPEGADIVCSSNDDAQANILYVAIDTMRQMIDPKNKDTWRNQQNIRNLTTNTKVFKISDKTRNKEGRSIDYGIVDEVHEMKDNTVVKSIEQSQSLKPNPKLILITTEGFVNGGFLDEETKRARAILNGEDDSISAERYLPWLYTQDSEQEIWQDEETWVKSNPSLGTVKRWDYMREQVDLARKSKADRMFVLSKDFNIKVNDSQAWLMRENVEYKGEYNLDTFRGTIALGAVDLAETTDMCSAKILMLRPGDTNTKYIHSMYWIPESKLEKADDREAGARYQEWAQQGYLRIVEGNEVDVAVVADWFYELYRDAGIRTYITGYDQRFAKEFLRRMDEYGFETEMIYQSRYVLSTPMRLVEADLKDQKIIYNQNPIDQWCLLNTSIQMFNTGHIMPVKIKNQAARRIDGAVTMIMAEEMLRRHKTEILNAIG